MLGEFSSLWDETSGGPSLGITMGPISRSLMLLGIPDAEWVSCCEFDAFPLLPPCTPALHVTSYNEIFHSLPSSALCGISAQGKKGSIAK